MGGADAGVHGVPLTAKVLKGGFYAVLPVGAGVVLAEYFCVEANGVGFHSLLSLFRLLCLSIAYL